MADINEIISKEAIEGLKTANKLFTEMDDAIKKVIAETKGISTSFNSMAASQENIAAGQKKIQTQTEKLTQIQKDEAKALKEVENAAKALDKQRQAALSILAKQEAKERELQATLKMEVKTLQDAQKQNAALTQARKTLDLTTKQGQTTLLQYNATMTKNTEFIRQNATAMEKQKMNIGNYSSAFDGIGAKLAGAFSITAILAFGRAAFKAFEEQEQANRKLLFSLNGNKQAFKELTKQANDFQSKTGIADDAIQGIQVLAAESGKTTAEIKKITEATITWSKITGQDLQSAYLQINGTLNGTAGRLTRVDAEFGKLTKSQLESGAAIDLINTKFKGFAENATTDTERLSASWEEFKESMGEGISDVVSPILEAASKAMDEISNKKGFWQKMATLFGGANAGGINTISTVFDAKNAINDSKGIEGSDTYIKAQRKEADRAAKMKALDLKKEEREKEESAKKVIMQTQKQATEYEKLTSRITDLKSQMTELRLADKTVPDSMIRKLISSEAQLENVKKQVEAIAAGMVAIQSKGIKPAISLSPNTGTPLTRRASVGSGGAAANVGPKDTFFASDEERKQFAIDQAQVVADTTFQIMANAANAELDLKLSNLEKEKQARLDVAKTEEQKAKIEAEYAKKAAKIKTEQFKKQKSADIIQAIINTALSVTKAGAFTALGIANAIAGAAQIAIIKAQKIPQFDSGSSSTPSQFIAGEKRPEFIITPSGGVQLVTRPTLFKNMAGATVIGGEETAEIMKASGSGSNPENIAPYIKSMEANIVNAIKNKREIHITGKAGQITEREGNYYKTYFNRRSWVGRTN